MQSMLDSVRTILLSSVGYSCLLSLSLFLFLQNALSHAVMPDKVKWYIAEP
jgi:hypothetical protein